MSHADSHRAVYRPPAARRIVGVGASATLYAVVAILLVFEWRSARPPAGSEQPALTVINLAAVTPAPTPPAPAPSHAQVRSTPSPHQPAVTTAATASPDVSAALLPGNTGVARAAPAAAASPASPATAPPAPPAAPASPPASASGEKSWESEVLARLYLFRRYPASSRQRHEEGQPIIRFKLDRTGRVLSSELKQGSGFTALDREAMSLPLRAQPLPPPPPDRSGSTITLDVPIEYRLNS